MSTVNKTFAQRYKSNYRTDPRFHPFVYFLAMSQLRLETKIRKRGDENMVEKFNRRKFWYCNRVDSTMLLHISRCVATIKNRYWNKLFSFVFASFADDPKNIDFFLSYKIQTTIVAFFAWKLWSCTRTEFLHINLHSKCVKHTCPRVFENDIYIFKLVDLWVNQ